MDNRAEKFGQFIIETINDTLELDVPENENQVKCISLLFAQYICILAMTHVTDENEMNYLSDKITDKYCGNSSSYCKTMSQYFEIYVDDMTDKTYQDIMTLFEEENDENYIKILRILTNYVECEIVKIYGEFEKEKVFRNALNFFKKMSNYLYPTKEIKEEENTITPKRKRKMKKVAKAIIKISNSLFEQGVSANGINARSTAFSYSYFIYLTAMVEPLDHNDILTSDETLINYVDKKEPFNPSQVFELMGDFTEALGKRFKEQISNTKSDLEVETTLKELFAFACAYFSENGTQLSVYDIQYYSTIYFTRLGKIIKIQSDM